MSDSVKNFLFIAFIFGTCQFGNAADARLYNGSMDNYTVISFANLSSLMNMSTFDNKKPTVMYTFGYGGKATGRSVLTSLGAYVDEAIANAILVNWEQEAAQGTGLALAAGYLNASANALTVGRELGAGIKKMVDAGYPLDNLLLLGFSLGVQLFTYTARYLQQNGLNITLFVALEPPGPLYEGPILKENAVSAKDAKRVIALHTNPGMLGTVEAQATVDIWFNYGKTVQPGCENSTESNGFGSPQAYCGHNRSWEFWAEAIRKISQFIARYSTSYFAWSIGAGSNITIVVGNNTDIQTNGSYYLRTNSSSPYGLGQSGSQP